jgi:hypothetical protein
MKDIWNNLWKNGIVLLVVVGLSYLLFARTCKQECPIKGNVLIPEKAWDSIKAIANRPPIVKIDTVWKERIIIKPSPQPPIPVAHVVDSVVNSYSDSLVNKEINVWVDYKVRGLLLERNWSYKPIMCVVTKDSISFVSVPYETIKLVKSPQNGLYGYLTAGGNRSSFLYGAGLDFINKKENVFGGMFQRFGSMNIYSVKLGMKFRF